MRLHLLAAAVISICTPFAAWAGGICLPIDPAIVSISGTLETRIFPGPPSYRSVQDGDAPEEVLMLVLAQPVCIAQQGKASHDETLSTGEIQITTYSPRQFKPYMSLPVTVSGTLFQSVAGHQHAPILMHALSVQPNV